jgi:hypothetical protein
VVEDISATPELLELSDSSSGAAYAADYQLFPDTPAEDDAAYFGGSIPFPELFYELTATFATYNADSTIWEYWNGSAWTTLMAGHGLYDHTDSDDQDGDRSFQRDGAVVFIPPSNWATTTINGQLAYWVRCRCIATVDFTQVPLMETLEHQFVAPADGFKCNESGRIAGCRIVNANATAHSGNDILGFVHNFTTGVRSDELTFAQDKRNERFDGAAFKTGGLAVTKGDVLGWITTQEDGTDELTNFTLELAVER